MKRTLSLVLLILIAAICSGQLALNGVLFGPVLDYCSTHGGSGTCQTGDTQFMSQTAATYADGSSAGTSLINRGDGAGTVSLSGQQVAMWNDGTAPGGVGRSMGLYRFSTLDLTNATNTTEVLVNSMDDYGSSGAPNVPAGWHGKASSLDHARGGISGSNWKTNAAPLTFGGWIIINPIRQGVAAFYESADSTLVASPDGGAHWCNPFTYFSHSGSPGCDAANWSATGDPPLCGAADFNVDCTDSGYNDATHSSMMWHDIAPFDGRSNRMGRIWWFDYCQAQACTGMPNGADTYLYGFSSTGAYGATILFRVAKSGGIAFILDPAHYEFYSASSYSNTNVGDGTSWTSTLSSAVNVFIAAQSAGIGTAIFASGWTQVFGMWDHPVYLCFNGGCGYAMSTSIPTLNNTGNQSQVVTFPAPWGPYTVKSQFAQPANTYAEFPQLIRHSAFAVGSTPYQGVITQGYDNPSVATSEKSLFWQQLRISLAPGEVGAQPRGQSHLKFTYSPTSGALISRSIINYFDLRDNIGYSEWATIGSLDVSHQPSSLPTRQLIGCYFDASTSCGIPRPTKGLYNTALGWAIEDGPGFAPYGDVRDIQLNAGTAPNFYNPLSDTTFSSNGNYTVDFVGMTTDISANQGFFNAGPVTQQFYIYNFSGNPGGISFSYQPTAGSFPGVGTPNGTIANNVWFHFTGIHTATSHFCAVYINGVLIASNVVSPSPNVGTGEVTIGRTSAGAGNSMQGQLAGIGWWNRVLDSSEIAHNHAVLKANMATRGITLP